jgi:tetratricopeptide (TPR) repeat protein
MAFRFIGWWQEGRLLKEWKQPFGRTFESLFVVLDAGSTNGMPEWLRTWTARVLPDLNWRSHLFVVGGKEGESEDFTEELLAVVTEYLESRGYANLQVHPLVRLDASLGTEAGVWGRLVDVLKPFQQEAHTLLSEARLHIAPVLEPTAKTSIDDALSAAEFFRTRLAIPSFYLAGNILPELSNRVSTEDARFFIDPMWLGLPVLLWHGHVFETMLDRVEQNVESIISPCNSHLVADVRKGRVFSCFYSWYGDGPGVDLMSQKTDPATLLEAPEGGDCSECMTSAALAIRENLRTNQREAEGRKVFFKLSLQLAGRGKFKSAADLAFAAFEFSKTDPDRTVALIQQALCLRELGQLEQADGVLATATEFTQDQGQIAYHRGRVQFVWRDYIEALDWYEEALDSGSAQVPVEDMCFEMALCHINIEEYPEARPYLDRSQKPGEDRAPVAFYYGVCDYGEGKIGAALKHFGKALTIGPAPEDLGRVMFYKASCYKELDRFGEAVEVLREAIEVDPKDLANHNLLGFCYYKLKRHEEAVACFLRAVEIDPSSGIDWANLASNLRDLGKTKEAVAMYEKALSLDPTIAFARDNLKKLKHD